MDDSKYAFEIYDAIGQQLISEVKTVFSGSNMVKLSINDMASAMYVVKVYGNRKALTKQVFVRSEFSQ